MYYLIELSFFISTLLATHLTPIRMAIIKAKQKMIVGKNVEKKDHFHIVGTMVNLIN
jgi:hypothetical protein